MNSSHSQQGRHIYDLAAELFPICRSLSGEGVRTTLKRLQDFIPLKIHEIPSGTDVFDWTVPPEWNIREAWIKNDRGEKVVDFSVHNLHVLGYSTPVDQTLPLSELREHLYTLPEQPDAIPYITSYYKERWGFCLSENQLSSLPDGDYHVYIDSDLKPGVLNYADLVIPGESTEEILFSTYICHPSMANNELSGPCLATFLAQWVMQKKRRYTYRFVFLPETIGSIIYLSRHLQHLQKNVIAGYVLTCCGDDRDYSFLESRNGNTLADRAALTILQENQPHFKFYSYLTRGSDERQYCAPGVDLPVASIMRSKYGVYPEYHTSLDDMDLISHEGLQGAYDIYTQVIDLIERNDFYQINCLCEPQLGKRGLYPDLSTKQNASIMRAMTNFIAYADGSRDLISIAEKIGVPTSTLIPIAQQLTDASLLTRLNAPIAS